MPAYGYASVVVKMCRVYDLYVRLYLRLGIDASTPSKRVFGLSISHRRSAIDSEIAPTLCRAISVSIMLYSAVGGGCDLWICWLIV